MPGASKPRSTGYDYDDDRPPSADQNDRDTDTPKTAAKKQESRSKEESRGGEGKGSKGGWLGGILTKLSLRAPNQMILPDDKNPSIVWDAETKRWRNLDSDGDEPGQPPPPPPKSVHLPHVVQSTSPPLSTAGVPPVSNIFKMQKGRHIKKSYVDVFNPPGAPPAQAPAPLALPPPAPLALPSNYFVPAQAPQELINDFPEAIEVSIPSSPAVTPPPSPYPVKSQSDKSGMYEPSMLADREDDIHSYRNSGI